MIIVLKPGSSDADIEDVSRRVKDMGFRTHLSRGEVRTIVGVVGEDRAKEQLPSSKSTACPSAARSWSSWPGPAPSSRGPSSWPWPRA